MRKAEIARKTNETDIKLSLDLDGSGKSEIRCGCGFLEHMLTLFAKHGHFDLTLSCTGDTYVDDHHTVEDIGIVLGEAFNKALGDKKGIERYADTILPMDESLVLTAVDLSGRAHLSYSLDIPTEKVGTFDTELCEEFEGHRPYDSGKEDNNEVPHAVRYAVSSEQGKQRRFEHRL